MGSLPIVGQVELVAEQTQVALRLCKPMRKTGYIWGEPKVFEGFILTMLSKCFILADKPLTVVKVISRDGRWIVVRSISVCGRVLFGTRGLNKEYKKSVY